MANAQELIDEFTGGKGHEVDKPGYRPDPFTGKGREYHAGYDIGGLPVGYGLTTNAPVQTYAPPSQDRIFGNRVAVYNPQTGQGEWLSHLQEPGTSGTYQPGQVVGKVGNTGRSTAPHVDITDMTLNEIKKYFGGISTAAAKAIKSVTGALNPAVTATGSSTQPKPSTQAGISPGTRVSGGQTAPNESRPGALWDSGGVTYQNQNGRWVAIRSSGGGGGMPEPQNSTNVPANYTGYWGLDPYLKGGLQTRGGDFTPFGDYSAGYGGSGEHPEITGSSTPGIYGPDPSRNVALGLHFGSIIKPDIGNRFKAKNYLNYLAEMGFDISGVDDTSINKMVDASLNGKFDGLGFIQSLPQPNPEKTGLISAYAVLDDRTPTAQLYALLGGKDYSKLFTGQSANAPTDVANKINEYGQTIDWGKHTSTPETLKAVGGSMSALGQLVGGQYTPEDVLQTLPSYLPVNQMIGSYRKYASLPAVTPQPSALAQAKTAYAQQPASTYQPTQMTALPNIVSAGNIGGMAGIGGMYNNDANLLRNVSPFV